jgi:hypothetical protein
MKKRLNKTFEEVIVHNNLYDDYDEVEGGQEPIKENIQKVNKIRFDRADKAKS